MFSPPVRQYGLDGRISLRLREPFRGRLIQEAPAKLLDHLASVGLQQADDWSSAAP